MSKEKAPTLDDVLQSFRLCAPLFHALGDKQRQDIIMLLVESERLNVSAITERMPLSRPAISHHLKVLRQAGLVKVESESRENYYSLTLDEGLLQLKQLVMQAEQSCV
ncbi:metalloregulator ArsR/SmtB family transcription factor [Noviherbaspirillum sp.]|uniref:ArsR/SmtB family transcription factor n=1 Tax=Noviherbaspirillum sp. TaxID=1926288 RepID=UPI002B48468B|nr:metalloregulator ArsR/SmtB family transcription factor [Noviherbaspirillum sp.]HJV80465.1 metalloregulator ArsR/SmtB family transcription factor [Noviherbaspirillum sp.]